MFFYAETVATSCIETSSCIKGEEEGRRLNGIQRTYMVVVCLDEHNTEKRHKCSALLFFLSKEAKQNTKNIFFCASLP